MKRSRCEYRGAARAARLVLPMCLTFGATAVQAQDDPFGESWPAGDGRELTGAWCGGCHSLNLVRQQGLTHDGWNELLHWMTEKQNMPPLKGEQRTIVLDYLAANFGTDRGGASARAGQGDTLESLTPVQGISRPLLEIRPRDEAG